MMGELTGGLIQMNSHMVVSKFAQTMIITGSILFVVVALLALLCWPDTKNRLKHWVPFLVCLCIAAIAAGMVVYGAKMPRQKIIKACANGAISLETVSSRYDIIEVDGSELTLRVR